MNVSDVLARSFSYIIVIYIILRSTMAMQCFFAPCQGKKNDFKKCGVEGIRTLIARSEGRGDEIHEKLQSILASDGENASVMCHKSCYSSYTSVSRHLLLADTKRKSSGWPPSDEPPARISRSHVFFLRIFCSKEIVCSVARPVSQKILNILKGWNL